MNRKLWKRPTKAEDFTEEDLFFPFFGRSLTNTSSLPTISILFFSLYIFIISSFDPSSVLSLSLFFFLFLFKYIYLNIISLSLSLSLSVCEGARMAKEPQQLPPPLLLLFLRLLALQRCRLAEVPLPISQLAFFFSLSTPRTFWSLRSVVVLPSTVCSSGSSFFFSFIFFPFVFRHSKLSSLSRTYIFHF